MRNKRIFHQERQADRARPGPKHAGGALQRPSIIRNFGILPHHTCRGHPCPVCPAALFRSFFCGRMRQSWRGILFHGLPHFGARSIDASGQRSLFGHSTRPIRVSSITNSHFTFRPPLPWPSALRRSRTACRCATCLLRHPGYARRWHPANAAFMAAASMTAAGVFWWRYVLPVGSCWQNACGIPPRRLSVVQVESRLSWRW